MSSYLAKRAVACKHWRWMRGMSAICENGWRVLRGTDTWGWDDHGNWPGGPPYRDLAATLNREILPDLTDPATLGCLLALVREAWGDPGLHCAASYSRQGWTWEVLHSGVPKDAFRQFVERNGYPTEAEALVAALESAPC